LLKVTAFFFYIEEHPNIANLRTAYNREKEGHKTAKAKLKAFDGFKPEEYTTLQSEVEELRETNTTLKAQVGAGGKTSEEELTRRLEAQALKMNKTYDVELKTRDEQITGLKTQVVGMTRQQNTQKVERTIEVAAGKAGVRPEAVGGIVRMGKEVFSYEEESGIIVALDESEEVIRGKDNVALLTPFEWLKETVYKEHSYLWPNNTGSGAGGGGGGGKHGIHAKEDFKSVDDESAFILEHGRQTYLDLPGKSKFTNT